MYPAHYLAKKWLQSGDFPFNITKTWHPEGHPVHTHDFFESVYVIKGRATHLINGEKYRISRGDMFFLKPGESHAYEVLNRSGIEIINLLFLPSLLNEPECLKLFDSPRRFKIHLTGALSIRARELLEIMFDELVHKRPGYKQIIKAYLTELLITLARIFESEEKLERIGNLNDLRKQAILCAIKYVEKNYKENFKLDEIAKKAHLTANYFCEVFKKVTGKPVIEYRNELRIRESRLLLRSPAQNITSISLVVGFNDLTHFERIFKKYTGLSPRDYRAQFIF